MEEVSVPIRRGHARHDRFAHRVSSVRRGRSGPGRVVVAGCVAGAVAVAALGASSAQAAVSAAKTTKLRILVTDDDGPTTPGIDALVPALRKLPNVEVVVAMPATNQSGKGDSTTPGARTGVQTTTPGGYPAYAVDGTPADTVAWALANLKRPQVVVSGVNDGQNLGAITKISGTVGAARTAARAGIPALAVSQGLGNPVPYGVAAQYALQWVKIHRGLILKSKRTGPILFENLNAPTCTAGSIRGQVTVPVATTATNAVSPADCTSTMTRPADDITAFLEGYVALSPLTTN